MNPRLPEPVLSCIRRLEAAGFEAWTVGGCVRDACLGLTPHDYDLCTSALPEQTRQVFAGENMFLAGLKHGTVSVVLSGQVIEITTYRTEGDYLDNRHPAWVRFLPEITGDLARRDFTVNAMAWSPDRGLRDPFGGREDLERRVLRAVGDPWQRFREDALRILRGVRFAVRYDLTPEEQTWQAMLELLPLLEGLSRERVYEELSGILLAADGEQLRSFGPILAGAIPELGPMLGFDQHSPHHAYDLFTHTAYVTGGVPRQLELRWAALLHDVGKVDTFFRDENGRGHFYGHASAGAEKADHILRRLKAPTVLREEAVAVISLHMTRLEEDEKILKRRLSRLGWDTVERLLLLQEADMGSKGTGENSDPEQFDRVRALLDKLRRDNVCLRLKDLAVNGHDMMALGYRGREIGEALEDLLTQVLEGRLPNHRPALLHRAESRKPPA